MVAVLAFDFACADVLPLGERLDVFGADGIADAERVPERAEFQRSCLCQQTADAHSGGFMDEFVELGWNFRRIGHRLTRPLRWHGAARGHTAQATPQLAFRTAGRCRRRPPNAAT